MAEISPQLAAAVNQSSPGSMVEVVIHLPRSQPAIDLPRSDRGSDMAAMRSAFETVAGPIARVIVDAGGEVVENAWINQTIRARVPSSNVGRLVDLSPGTRLDVPRRLARD